MNNVKKLKLNTNFSLISQILTVISGLILPRFILQYYGSDTNGLIASIRQFLSIITFLELGVGAVVQSTLYKPIVNNNHKLINKVLKSAQNFFRKLAYILVFYVLSLMIFFPIVTSSPFSYFEISFLILGMSLSLFSQYYFGIVNILFLNANEKNYVQTGASILTVLLNTIFSIILIINGASIQLVQLITGIIYLARPIFLNYYVQNNYHFLDNKVEINNDKEIIPQKWNGVAQHIAYTITNSTDIVIITLFSTLENVSVYSIHNMVVNGIKLLFNSITGGIESFFGALLNKEDQSELNYYFTNIEWLIHTSVTYVFGLTALLINPFVLIYTNNVFDANYDMPLFALLLSFAQAFASLRIPYHGLVKSGGHFKQTQSGAVIEAFINVSLSLILINIYGLVGIAFGTLLAIIYKTLYLVVYLSKNLVFRPVGIFFKHLLVDSLSFLFIVIVANFIPFFPRTFQEWINYSILLGLVYLVICFALNYIFYRKLLMNYIYRILRK